jgi:hypothetical protein
VTFEGEAEAAASALSFSNEQLHAQEETVDTGAGLAGSLLTGVQPTPNLVPQKDSAVGAVATLLDESGADRLAQPGPDPDAELNWTNQMIGLGYTPVRGVPVDPPDPLRPPTTPAPPNGTEPQEDEEPGPTTDRSTAPRRELARRPGIPGVGVLLACLLLMVLQPSTPPTDASSRRRRTPARGRRRRTQRRRRPPGSRSG